MFDIISFDELNTPPETKQPAEIFTPNQPTVYQLTQELAQSTRQNEEYTKLIAELTREQGFAFAIQSCRSPQQGHQFVTQVSTREAYCFKITGQEFEF